MASKTSESQVKQERHAEDGFVHNHLHSLFTPVDAACDAACGRHSHATHCQAAIYARRGGRTIGWEEGACIAIKRTGVRSGRNDVVRCDKILVALFSMYERDEERLPN